jgi:ABC-2 type transport system ATP-binding protein
MKAIEVKNLTKKFGDFVAVNQITFDVNPGEVFGLLGPNGAGKTTTIRMLCGLLKPTSGSGYVGGCDIIKEYEKIKNRVGYMSQKFSLYKDLTVEENIEFFCGIYRLKGIEKKRRKDWALEISGLTKMQKMIVGELPGGFKQRLALVCSLLHSPEILFLDEPTAGVDPISRTKFWSLIYHLKKTFKTTVLVTTHYMDEAEHCERIALIREGMFSAIGTPLELKTLVKDPVYLIKTSDYFKTKEILRKKSFVMDIIPFGNACHIFLDKKGNPEELKNDLLKSGIEILKFEQITPSLEDVFLSLIKK